MTQLTGTRSLCSTMIIRYIKKSYQTRYKYIKRYINPQQTTAIKGRTIIGNLQLNQEVVSNANAKKIQGAMIQSYIARNRNKAQVALDQEKTFDRINLNFLFKALQLSGYGPKIIQKIKAVYQNTETQVKVNGHLSQVF